MKINFFDLTYQYEQIRSDVVASITKILETQHFILGENVRNFEKEFAEYCGTKYCVAMSSGTDAILAALMAIGVGPGDEVILPDFTFFATAGVVARLFAKPVFVDVCPDTFCIDTNLIEKYITQKTKAIIPVHIFGQCADMDVINEIAAKHNIAVIEDSAQGVGAEYKDGRKAGNLGLMGCFSFYPTKNLGGAGDSGAITTNDEQLYNKLIQMRNHGMEPKYYHSFVGGNFRMDEIQAAVLRTKLPHLEDWNKLRRINHNFYRKYFIDSGLITKIGRNSLSDDNFVVMPHKAYLNSGVTNFHTFHQFSVLVQRRDELKQFLNEKGIGSDIYYPVPLHKQVCFENYTYDDSDYANTDYICKHIISLPIYPEILEQQILEVVETISEFYKHN